MNKYQIITTKEFEEELEKIYYYFLYFLKEIKLAKLFYSQIINSIFSLEYFPKRYNKVSNFLNYNNRDIRKLIIKKYIIIYEVNDILRTSYNSTYISSVLKII